MENLKKISLFSVLLALILALSAANVVHAVGVIDTITVGGMPNGVAYDLGKGEIFVANYNLNNVWIISDSNNSVIATVPVGLGPSKRSLRF